jgi:high-affinity Fe2+/Pb2+ permease
VNAFHVSGVVFVIWAITVAVLGITRQDFPGSKSALRLVAAISVLLAALAIGTAIYVGATEESGGKKANEHGSFLLPV